VFVTAKPDTETIPVDGLTTKDVIVESPKPDPLEVLTAVIKNDWFNAVEVTATEDAAEDGTGCQDGVVLTPFEVRT
jgi:hypothetical protein